MTVYQLLGLIVGALILYLFLKQAQERFALLLIAGVGLVILLFVLKQIPALLDFTKELAGYANVNEQAFQSVLKGLAICYLGDMTVGICKDFGVPAWCEKIELACRCSLLLIALPLFRDFLSLLTGMLK